MNHYVADFLYYGIRLVACLSLGIGVNVLLKRTAFYKRMAKGVVDADPGRRVRCLRVYLLTTLALVSLLPIVIWHFAVPGFMPFITFTFSGYGFFLLIEKPRLLSRSE